MQNWSKDRTKVYQLANFLCLKLWWQNIKFTCMPTSMDIVRDDATSSPSILARTYPKKKPEAWRRQAAKITCPPDIRIAEELCAIAFPHKIATVATAKGGINGDTSLTRGWKYWFSSAPTNTGKSTTCYREWRENLILVTMTKKRYNICDGKLTCNVEINKPAASTATYLPASLAVRKGVMICNVK